MCRSVAPRNTTSSRATLEGWLPAQVRDPRGCPGLWAGLVGEGTACPGRGEPILFSFYDCLASGATFPEVGSVSSWFLPVPHLSLDLGAVWVFCLFFPQSPFFQMGLCFT